jgi:hypothetical protein
VLPLIRPPGPRPTGAVKGGSTRSTAGGQVITLPLPMVLFYARSVAPSTSRRIDALTSSGSVGQHAINRTRSSSFAAPCESMPPGAEPDCAPLFPFCSNSPCFSHRFESCREYFRMGEMKLRRSFSSSRLTKGSSLSLFGQLGGGRPWQLVKKCCTSLRRRNRQWHRKFFATHACVSFASHSPLHGQLLPIPFLPR